MESLPLRITLVVGSYPPDICGVGDYTAALKEALAAVGGDVDVAVWSRLSWVQRANLLHPADQTHIVHFQYPSVGYGYSIAPQLFSISKRYIVTLHEFTRVSLARRIAEIPFLWRSYVVFTTSYEQQAATVYVPALKQRSTVIPIGSNIPATFRTGARDMSSVIYFGLIAPKKGLDDVFELAATIKSQTAALRVRIVGNIVPEHSEYASQLTRRAVDLPIDWSLNLEAEQASQLFSRTAFAYLPFPDGASERRGSLKALLASGIPCITTAGRQTSEQLSRVVMIAENPRSTVGIIDRLRSDADLWHAKSAMSLRYSEQWTWANIARKHLELYEHLHSK